MEQLRELFMSLKFSAVKTFIASGNVIFETSRTNQERLELQIEGTLLAALGFEVATFIRSGSELKEIARRKAFGSDELSAEGNALYIGFLKTHPSAAARQAVVSLGTATHELKIEGRELYWLCPTKISDSPVSGARIEKKLAGPMTMRNATTIRKIAALVAPDPA